MATIEELLTSLGAQSAAELETGPLPTSGTGTNLAEARQDAASKRGKFRAINILTRSECLVTKQQMDDLISAGASRFQLGASDAVVSALESAANLLKRSRGELRLEEVNRDEERNHWLVTVSYLVPDETPQAPKLFKSPMPEAPRVERLYKVVVIDQESGQFVGLRNHGK